MSAYSYQQPPFLLDAVFYQNNSNNSNHAAKASRGGGFAGFSQFYSSEPLTQQEIQASGDGKGNESSSCLDHSSNELSAVTTRKQSTENSSSLLMDHRIESGDEQVTEMMGGSSVIDKRKHRDASSLTTADHTSKDDGKKQKKMNSPFQKEEGKKNSKSDNKRDPNKAGEEAPKGYIHVRARRGQATDSHSLAERVRREKISERMKLLQSLVPGCDKVTGKALMLDEIINYVQSLQNQVELLSMKLASVNPVLFNFGMDLDAFMVRPERLNSLASPQLPPVQLQQCSSTQPIAFGDHTAATFSAAPNYPLLDTSTSLLLHHQGQRTNAFLQENGNLLWDADEQRQKLSSQAGFPNNLCSFH